MAEPLPPDLQAYIDFMLETAGSPPEMREVLEAIARSQMGLEDPVAVILPAEHLDQSIAFPRAPTTRPSG